MWNKKNTDLIEEMQNAPYNVLQELQANTISGLASSKKIKGWKGLEAGLGFVSQITGSMSDSVRKNSGTKTTDLTRQDKNSGTKTTDLTRQDAITGSMSSIVRNNSGAKTTDLPIQGEIVDTPIEVAEPAYDIWKMSMPMLNPIPTYDLGGPVGSSDGDYQTVLADEDEGYIDPNMEGFNYNQLPEGIGDHEVPFLLPEGAQVFSNNPFGFADANKARAKQLERYDKIQAENNDRIMRATIERLEVVNKKLAQNDMEMQELYKKAVSQSKRADKLEAENKQIKDYMAQAQEQENLAAKIKNKKQRRLAREQQEEQENQAMAQLPEIGLEEEEQEGQPQSFTFGGLVGDAALMAGTLFTSLANRRNTDRQQQATLPNVNVYAGIQGYNDMLYQRQLQDIERQQNLQNQSIKSNLTAQLNTNKNNTRSSSVQRVLDATVYGQANKAHQQTSIQASQLRNQLDAQKRQMDMKADVYYRQGEAARRLADQQDIDNYYSQIAKDNTGMGETITRAASLINERSNLQRQQDYFTNSMLQQYGYAATEGGAFVKNKETGEITFQPFETKENPFLAFLRERLFKKR